MTSNTPTTDGSADRFGQAIERIDAVNRTDPRRGTGVDASQPRELAFSRRVYEWVKKLSDDPSDALLLAARGHTIARWRIPRDRYPATTLGYHEWRDALARMHADETSDILHDVGYSDDIVARVADLITRKRFPDDPESRVLEDADCLVFLESKLAGYVDEWGEKKTLHILRRTVAKMTPAAQVHALELELGPREMELVRAAAQADSS